MANVSLLERFRNWMDARALTFLSVVFGRSFTEEPVMKIERYFHIQYVRFLGTKYEETVSKLFTSKEPYPMVAVDEAWDFAMEDPLAHSGWLVRTPKLVAHHELLALRCDLMAVEVMMNVPERAKR